MKFDWLWQARFSDGKIICQPEDDKYSKHDDTKDFNPSSFRDFLDYFHAHRDKLTSFGVVNANKREVVVVRFDKKKIRMFKYKDGELDVELIHEETNKLNESQPIYFRKIQNTITNGVFGEPELVAYSIGYQGKDKNGKNTQFIYEIKV